MLVDIVCEHCSKVLGSCRRPARFNDEQWENAKARAKLGYACADCAKAIRPPNWWPHGWLPWPAPPTPPPFWPLDLSWPPEAEEDLTDLRRRLIRE